MAGVDPRTFPVCTGDDLVEYQVYCSVTDRLTFPTAFRTDNVGRPVESTNAKDQTTTLSWDDDHNVTQLEEANTAKTTWLYDPKTGYPLEIKSITATSSTGR